MLGYYCAASLVRGPVGFLAGGTAIGCGHAARTAESAVFGAASG